MFVHDGVHHISSIKCLLQINAESPYFYKAKFVATCTYAWMVKVAEMLRLINVLVIKRLGV